MRQPPRLYIYSANAPTAAGLQGLPLETRPPCLGGDVNLHPQGLPLGVHTTARVVGGRIQGRTLVCPPGHPLPRSGVPGRGRIPCQSNLCQSAGTGANVATTAYPPNIGRIGDPQYKYLGVANIHNNRGTAVCRSAPHNRSQYPWIQPNLAFLKFIFFLRV